jgi:hypothetical protein
MAKRTKKSKGSTPDKYQVDFSKEQGGGGGGVHVKEGDYVAKIVKIEATETGDSSKNPGTPMLVFDYQLVKNAASGKKVSASGTIRDRIVIQPNTLWRLRKLLEAIGKTVPKKTVNLSLKKYVGETFILTVVDGEPYKGKVKSEPADYLSEEEYEEEPDDDEDEDEDEDEDAEDEDEDDDEDEDEDEDDDDDLEEMDVDEDL